MAFILRTNSEILSELLAELRRTGLSYSSRSSKGYALASSISKEIEIAQQFFDNNFEGAYLRNASGVFLDALGELFGLRRREARKSYSLSSENNVTFYVEEGTFGDINSNNDISIPAGTIVQTSQLVDVQTPIQYELTSDVTLPAAGTNVAITVKSLLEGSISRVGPGTITIHGFVGYTDNINDTLKVTNTYAILNGEDRQTDAEYKYLISRAATANQAGNLTAIRFAALSVPGVTDTNIINYFDGIGTVGVFVVGQDNQPSQPLTNEVQSALALIQSNGILASAYSPGEVGVSWSTKVTVTTPLTINARNELNQKLINISRDFLTALRIGESLNLTDLALRLTNADSRIVRLGTGTEVFENLGIWRVSLADGARVRSSALSQANILIQAHEIIVPELTLSNAFGFVF